MRLSTKSVSFLRQQDSPGSGQSPRSKMGYFMDNFRPRSKSESKPKLPVVPAAAGRAAGVPSHRLYAHTIMNTIPSCSDEEGNDDNATASFNYGLLRYQRVQEVGVEHCGRWNGAIRFTEQPALLGLPCRDNDSDERTAIHSG